MYRDGIDINNEVRDELFGEYVDSWVEEEEALEALKGEIAHLLEALEEKEKSQEQQRYKKSHPRPYMTKLPKDFFKHPIYSVLKEVIIVPQKEKVLPRRWEELEVDFLHQERRYASLCHLEVYRVTNQYTYQQWVGKEVALAIPIKTPLFEEIYACYEEEIAFYGFVQVSRRIIQEAGYEKEREIHSCTTSEVVGEIEVFLKNKTWISWEVWRERYRVFGVELEAFIKEENRV